MKQIFAVVNNATVYQLDGHTVKTFNEDFPKYLVLGEAFTHSIVEETGLPVPKILEVSKTDGKWSITRELIEGKTLRQMMDENPDKMDEYLEVLVDIQMEIHKKRSPFLQKLKDKHINTIKEMDGIDETTRYELLTRLDSVPKHTKLCHGDFRPSNVIFKGDQYYIVGWMEASQGNASADVARTYLLLSLEYPREAEKYVDLFCKKSNTPKKYFQEWLPIVAAYRLAQHDGTPEEKALLHKWVDVSDFE